MSSTNDNDNKNNNEAEESGACGCCNNIALKVNSFIEKAFAAVGFYIGKYPTSVLILVITFLGVLCLGYAFTAFTTDIFDLWTPTDSEVFSEREFINEYWSDAGFGLLIISGVSKKGEDVSILSEEYMSDWYQLHLDLAANLPTKDYSYLAADNSPQTTTFSYFPKNYEEPLDVGTILARAAAGVPAAYTSEVVPLCRHFSTSPAEAQFQMPCYLVSVLDCFSEGGYFFPYENYLQRTLLGSAIPANPYTFRDSFYGQSPIELGEALGPSCQVFNLDKIQPNLIMGGETRVNNSDPTSTIIDLKTLQTVFFIDSPYSLARKFKILKGECLYTSTYGVACPDPDEDEIQEAEDFRDEWLNDYIDFMQDYIESIKNDDTRLFDVVFWTPRTPTDLLRDASQADFGLLALAYIVMIVFAAFTAINFNNAFLSRSEASSAGVLLVLFAVVSTIGAGSFLQIPLSPNVVQVLPFIALGFGVDDMFVLLFSFRYRENAPIEDMISETTRIAGSSVALTSLANFFGFIIGTTMNLPDVARFSTYGAIIVLLNFIAIVFGFTAILTFTAQRMRNGFVDWAWLCCFAESRRAKETLIMSEKPTAVDSSVFDPLFDWLTRTTTRIVLMVVFFVLLIVAIYGCTLISPGLPLEDIVPTGSYASDFLRIREKFYFSYPVTLYTDSRGPDLNPIDWPNKFEEWVDETQQITSITDDVADDLGVHSFWAWDFKEYLAEKHASELSMEYTLGEVFDFSSALADLTSGGSSETTYQGYQCDADSALFCAATPRLYVYGADLYNCLLVNWQMGTLTSDECASWVEQVLYENIDLPFIAKQIEVISFEEDADTDVSGLYVRPSQTEIRVYRKYPDNDGWIYQPDCGELVCPWYLLSAEFETLYMADATSLTDSDAPNQGSWRSVVNGEAGERVKITHLYNDFIVQYVGIGRDADTFLATDVEPVSTFTFSNTYADGVDTTTNACVGFELQRLLMAESDAFTQIAMSNTLNSSYDVTCTAILESTEMCLGIRDESELGSLTCGARELFPAHNLWYLGTTSSDGLYQIVSAPYDGGNTDLFISEDTFTNCADPSLFRNNTELRYNFLKPCGSADNFGGFGLSQQDTSTHDDCNTQQLTANLECQAATDCTDLRVCYSDMDKLFSTGDSEMQSDCNVRTIGNFDTAYNLGTQSEFVLSQQLDDCLFSYYNQLSTCCQTAVNSYMLGPQRYEYTCDTIDRVFGTPKDDDQLDDLQAVCEQKDGCFYNAETTTCEEVATGSTFLQCTSLLMDGAPCSPAALNLTTEDLRSGNQLEIAGCLSQTVVYPASNLGSDLCQDTYNAEVATYGACLYPVHSYWDADAGAYDYSICTDAEIASVTNSTCGTINEDNSTQLTCLLPVVDSMDAGCCQRALQQIASNSYAMTNECYDDVVRVCADLEPLLAGTGLLLSPATVFVLYATTTGPLAALQPSASTCVTNLLTALATGDVSPKCMSAAAFCEPNDAWPATAVGGEEMLPCDVGFTGNKTRECVSGVPAVQWSEVDTSQCQILTCPTIEAADDSDYGQYWPETAIGSIHTIQGGAINAATGNAFVDDQVSTQLQTKLYLEQGLVCNPAAEEPSIYYARRKCQLDPYDSTQAVWAEPVVECRPIDGSFSQVLSNTVCDFVTEQVVAGVAAKLAAAFGETTASSLLASAAAANLIDVIPWSIYDATENGGVTTTPDEHQYLSQLYCTQALTNCAAYTYDSVLGISYFFDYCPTLNTQDFNGTIDALATSPANTAPIFPYAQYAASGLPDLGTLTAVQLAVYGPAFAEYYVTALGIFAGNATQAAAYVISQVPDITQWSYYDDAVWTALTGDVAPDGAGGYVPYDLKLDSFADRHTTYIAPLSSTASIAEKCSLVSALPALGTFNVTGNLVDDPVMIDAFISPSEAWNDEGIPRPECFNNTLWLYFIDPLGGVLSRDCCVFSDATQLNNLTGFDNVQLVTTSNTMIVDHIDDDAVAVEFILALRKRLDEWADKELYALPGGLMIDLFSQYIGVSRSLSLNLLYVSIAIILCGVVFLLNPIAVFVALLCNAAMVIEVYGFADWLGLRINGVLVLNIVIAVALTMEFTAHVARAFVLTNVTDKDRQSGMTLPGSNDGQIRMKKTLREMFTPVSLGALTTILGVMPIAFAQFPYFRQYYFTLYIMIVLFGWLNGVIFQPIILSLYPPRAFTLEASSSVDGAPLMASNVTSKPNDFERVMSDESDGNAPTMLASSNVVEEEAGDGGNTDLGYTDVEESVQKKEVIAKKHTRGDRDEP